MKVEEINKAYECCKDSFHRHCDDCPVTDDCCHDKMPLFVLKYALEMLKEQQHEIWELQDLNEHLTDQQKKIRMFVDSKGEIHPLEPEPVEPKEEENSNNLHGGFWTCGKCGQAITVSKGFVRYCWNCGTPVKWGG